MCKGVLYPVTGIRTGGLFSGTTGAGMGRGDDEGGEEGKLPAADEDEKRDEL